MEKSCTAPKTYFEPIGFWENRWEPSKTSEIKFNFRFEYCNDLEAENFINGFRNELINLSAAANNLHLNKFDYGKKIEHYEFYSNLRKSIDFKFIVEQIDNLSYLIINIDA